jgi:hypothetical protein
MKGRRAHSITSRSGPSGRRGDHRCAVRLGHDPRPGARFRPKAIREGDYLPPDGERPHLTAGIDPLTARLANRVVLELLTGMAVRRWERSEAT